LTVSESSHCLCLLSAHDHYILPGHELGNFGRCGLRLFGMTSFEPSSSPHVWSTAKSSSSSNIHDILYTSQSTTSGEAFQRESEQYRLNRPPCCKLPPVDGMDLRPRQAQTEMFTNGSSQKPCSQVTSLHAASLGQNSIPKTAQAQQSLSTVNEVNTMEPRPFRLPPVSTVEAPRSANSHIGNRYTTQPPSDHNSHVSVTPRHRVLAPSQFSITSQASTHSASFPASVAPIASHGAFGSQLQSDYSFQTPNDLIQIPVDLKSGSKASDKKRQSNSVASAKFRKRRKVREAETGEKVKELEKEVHQLKKTCELYREERDYYYNCWTHSGVYPRTGGLRTPSSGLR